MLIFYLVEPLLALTFNKGLGIKGGNTFWFKLDPILLRNGGSSSPGFGGAILFMEGDLGIIYKLWWIG